MKWERVLAIPKRTSHITDKDKSKWYHVLVHYILSNLLRNSSELNVSLFAIAGFAEAARARKEECEFRAAGSELKIQGNWGQTIWTTNWTRWSFTGKGKREKLVHWMQPVQSHVQLLHWLHWASTVAQTLHLSPQTKSLNNNIKFQQETIHYYLILIVRRKQLNL